MALRVQRQATRCHVSLTNLGKDLKEDHLTRNGGRFAFYEFFTFGISRGSHHARSESNVNELGTAGVRVVSYLFRLRLVICTPPTNVGYRGAEGVTKYLNIKAPKNGPHQNRRQYF